MMRKNYPYLLDTAFEDANGLKQKTNFLQEIDNFVNQKQYVKITLLNWNEEPIKEIQGELSGGSISKDGSSSVRRTCSLTAIVDRGEYNIEDSKMDFAINKKIYIECGIKNYSKHYKDYPILWFPQGVFFISNFSITSNVSSNISISLTLKDKMCGLNGEVGGTFPAAVILDEMDTQSPTGQFVHQKILIYDIIQEIVHHYGGEPLNNILIEDVPNRIKRVMRWTGENPLYLKAISADGYTWYEGLLDKPSDMTGVKQYNTNEDVGYTYADFVYDTELTANLGESVVTVLDKIKQYLGNYEYFYDEFGVFHFREIKNYLNTTQSKILLDDMDAKDYLAETTTGKTVYSFSDKTNIISITQNPQYANIKNDYVIQGLRKRTNSNASVLVRYHLAIDRKPIVGNTYKNLLLYEEADTNLIKAAYPLSLGKDEELPQPGNFNIIYRVEEDGESKFYYWEDEVYKEVKVKKYYSSASEGYTTKDWRTELYLQGLLAKNLGTDAGQYYAKIQDSFGANLGESFIDDIYRQQQQNKVDVDYYFEELDAFWPQIYNLETQKFYGEEEDKAAYTSSLADGNYYLDFIDPYTSGLGEFSIANIGRRTLAIQNDDVNCIFQPEVPDIVFLNTDDDDIDIQRDECDRKGQPYSQVKSNIYQALATGGFKNGAFDQIKYQLYLHTNYQKTLSLSALPVLYLEPNSRVEINDATTNAQGDFMAQSISIPLGAGNSMSVTLNQCLERF
jgi:hypothetical protein